jgi:hypothetical protein
VRRHEFDAENENILRLHLLFDDLDDIARRRCFHNEEEPAGLVAQGSANPP